MDKAVLFLLLREVFNAPNPIGTKGWFNGIMFDCLAILLAADVSTMPVHPAAMSPRPAVKCKVQSVVDTELSGKNAFSFLVPDGWIAHTTFRWLPPYHTVFASDLSISTPDLHAMVDCVEHTVLEFNSGVGSQQDRGVLIQKSSDFLRFRVSKLTAALKNVTDVEIVGEENLDLPADEAQQAGARLGSGDSMHQRTYLHQAGFLKVHFKLKGTPMTVNLGTTVFGQTNTIRIPGQARPSSVSQINRVGPTLTIMLESDAPAQRVTEAKVIASSFQMTPEFHSYWVLMTAHAAKVKIGINRAEQRASDLNWHERSMAAFRQQMNNKSSISHDFCNMAANQQDYKLGKGFVTLPNDCKGWYDAQGGILMVDDDPQFVPSGAGTKNFRALEAIHAGGK